MKIIDRIIRRVILLARRVYYEHIHRDLDIDEIDRRLRPDLRGRIERARYYSHLLDSWLNDFRPEVRAYAREHMPPQGQDTDPLLRRRIRLMGREIECPIDMNWHREPLHGVVWPNRYVGSISDYRDGSDLVLLWHLNKMMFLLDVSYAFCVTHNPEYVVLWASWVKSWMRDNRYMVGMNWRSPMEAGTRLVVWSLGLREIGRHSALTDVHVAMIVNSLVRHAEFIAGHFSQKNTPNNHLIGEAATLYTFATMWGIFAQAPVWKRQCEDILIGELDRQILKDGMDFEASFNYHVYVLDFYLLYLYAKYLEGTEPPVVVLQGVRAIAGFLLDTISPRGRIPHIGDDSLTEFFIVKSAESLEAMRFRHTICFRDLIRPEFAILIDEREWGAALLSLERPVEHASYHRESGVSVFRTPASHFVYVSGPTHDRPFSAGHLHSDACSFELELYGGTLFIDSGTYLYSYDPAAREYFRGAAAHNTLTIDGRERLTAAGTFDWQDVPRTQALWYADETICQGTASLQHLPSSTVPFEHRRLVVQVKDGLWLIADRVTMNGSTPSDRVSTRAPREESPALERPESSVEHQARLLFHTPLARAYFEGGGERISLRLPSRRRREPLPYDFARFSTVTGGMRLVSEPGDMLTSYSTEYGKLESGTTIVTELSFCKEFSVVHILHESDIVVSCRSIAIDGGVFDVCWSGGESERLSVHFKPENVELGGHRFGDVLK